MLTAQVSLRGRGVEPCWLELLKSESALSMVEGTSISSSACRVNVMAESGSACVYCRLLGVTTKRRPWRRKV